ncbi:MAG TPA: hypothetical protein VFG86_16560 [Chloroflexota bacterium]|jgi:hypothetical protein|nr:hypothetical protein [Chloroflexota bacterium]
MTPDRARPAAEHARVVEQQVHVTGGCSELVDGLLARDICPHADDVVAIGQ